MREVRLLARILRHGLWHLPLPGVPPSTPPDWSAYRAARRSGAHGQIWEMLLLMGARGVDLPRHRAVGLALRRFLHAR